MRTGIGQMVRLRYAMAVWLAVWLCGHGVGYGLETGDIMFIGFNADGNDDFAIVTFAEIAPDSTVYFTDNAWNGGEVGGDGTFNSGEGALTWETDGNALAAGTVIAFTNLSTTSYGVSTGLLSRTGSFNLSGETEGIFCYLGTSAAAPTQFLAAIANAAESAAFTNLTGTGLTLGSTALELANGTDIAAYTNARTGYLSAGYRALITNVAAWAVENGSGDQSANGIVPDVPFDITPFVLLAPSPETAAASVAFTQVTNIQMLVSWVNGSGENRLALMREGGAVASAPAAATTYTANAAFRSGDQIGAGNYVIFNGSGTSVLVTALSPGATYHVQVYEYNGGGEQTNYRWEDPASGSRTTVSQAPIVTQGGAVSVVMSENGNPTPFDVTIDATDIDPGDTLTWSLGRAPEYGVAVVSGSGGSPTAAAVSYVPPLYFSGEDEFDVTVTDAAGNAATITVTVAVTAENTGGKAVFMME
jgi:hypothetical protein